LLAQTNGCLRARMASPNDNGIEFSHAKIAGQKSA